MERGQQNGASRLWTDDITNLGSPTHPSFADTLHERSFDGYYAALRKLERDNLNPDIEEIQFYCV